VFYYRFRFNKRSVITENFTLVLRSEVFTAVRMIMMFFWVLGPCRLVGRCQRFGENKSPSSGLKLTFRRKCFHRRGLSHGDGDIMCLRNVGIYLRVYTAPEHRTPSFSPPHALYSSDHQTKTGIRSSQVPFQTVLLHLVYPVKPCKILKRDVVVCLHLSAMKQK
jgi:hypothetical protein